MQELTKVSQKDEIKRAVCKHCFWRAVYDVGNVHYFVAGGGGLGGPGGGGVLVRHADIRLEINL